MKPYDFFLVLVIKYYRVQSLPSNTTVTKQYHSYQAMSQLPSNITVTKQSSSTHLIHVQMLANQIIYKNLNEVSPRRLHISWHKMSFSDLCSQIGMINILIREIFQHFKSFLLAFLCYYISCEVAWTTLILLCLVLSNCILAIWNVMIAY